MGAQREVVVVADAGAGAAGVAAARRVLDAADAGIAWREIAAPERADAEDPSWRGLLDAVRGAGVALKAPLGARSAARGGDVALRHDLGLFASVRPIRTFPGVPSRYAGVDLVIVRELTEGLYAGLEFARGEAATAELAAHVAAASGHPLPTDVGLSLKANSVAASERIAEFAFAWAEGNARRTVTCGHKANIMKFTDGLFLDAARRVAARHPGVGFEERIIDALSMLLVQAPERFDVLLLPNLFGDLVSGLAAGLVGGAGLAPAGNFGDGVAVFEATAAPGEGAGGLPTALVLAGAMLLRHLGDPDAAGRVEAAVAASLAAGVGEGVAPDALADALVARLAADAGR